jgi:hypothetical protein
MKFIICPVNFSIRYSLLVALIVLIHCGYWLNSYGISMTLRISGSTKVIKSQRISRF